MRYMGIMLANFHILHIKVVSLTSHFLFSNQFSGLCQVWFSFHLNGPTIILALFYHSIFADPDSWIWIKASCCSHMKMRQYLSHTAHTHTNTRARAHRQYTQCLHIYMWTHPPGAAQWPDIQPHTERQFQSYYYIQRPHTAPVSASVRQDTQAEFLPTCRRLEESSDGAWLRVNDDVILISSHKSPCS